jgi:hypothetical protein
MKDLADSLKREGFAAAEVRVFRAHHALGDEELSVLAKFPDGELCEMNGGLGRD